jgi:hypothetical protein
VTQEGGACVREVEIERETKLEGRRGHGYGARMRAQDRQHERYGRRERQPEPVLCTTSRTNQRGKESRE